MKKNDLITLVGTVLMAEAAGVIGSIFTFSAIEEWYVFLNKPEFAPPNWVFGPVWTLLYALMGGALFLVWRQGWQRRGVKLAVGLFFLQLFLNTVWSILFFGLRSPGWALVEIVLLWLAIFFTIISFARVSPWAARLLGPYIAWVSFAAYLNYSIWQLNV